MFHWTAYKWGGGVVQGSNTEEQITCAKRDSCASVRDGHHHGDRPPAKHSQLPWRLQMITALHSGSAAAVQAQCTPIISPLVHTWVYSLFSCQKEYHGKEQCSQWVPLLHMCRTAHIIKPEECREQRGFCSTHRNKMKTQRRECHLFCTLVIGRISLLQLAELQETGSSGSRRNASWDHLPGLKIPLERWQFCNNYSLYSILSFSALTYPCSQGNPSNNAINCL